jgi:hypothetical protein
MLHIMHKWCGGGDCTKSVIEHNSTVCMGRVVVSVLQVSLHPGPLSLLRPSSRPRHHSSAARARPICEPTARIYSACLAGVKPRCSLCKPTVVEHVVLVRVLAVQSSRAHGDAGTYIGCTGIVTPAPPINPVNPGGQCTDQRADCAQIVPNGYCQLTIIQQVYLPRVLASSSSHPK